MTEIKTAQAWGYVTRSGGINCETTCVEGQYGNNDPVVIVHGLAESEVHEAAALLAKSREVCKWVRVNHANDDGLWASGSGYDGACNVVIDGLFPAPKFCPSCGRKVVVK